MMIERFDFAVSNPPYQDEKNAPIFQHIHTLGANMAERSSMIYMASRWWYGTSGLSGFREALLSDPRLQEVYYYTEVESSQLIFDGTGIAGGVNIVTLGSTNMSQDTTTDLDGKETPAFRLVENATGTTTHIPRGNLDIVPQRASLVNIAHKLQTGLAQFGMTTLLERGHSVVNEIGLSGAQLERLHPQRVTEDSAVPSGRVKIYANISGSKGGKSDYYTIDTPEQYVPNNRYKVCIGQSIIENENRALRLLQFNPDITFGRSTVSLAFFDTQQEADNFATYVSSRFFALCLRLSLAGRMRTFGQFVPDFIDYTADNTVLDWSQPLDPQLCEMFELSDEEQQIVMDGLF